jgi:hypothetical protein
MCAEQSDEGGCARSPNHDVRAGNRLLNQQAANESADTGVVRLIRFAC